MLVTSGRSAMLAATPSRMGLSLYSSLISLAGVMLGGGLSFVIQRFTQRAAERSEAVREEVRRAETRRTERMAALDKFLVHAQDAERVAMDRHLDDAQWRSKADATMDRVWVSEKMIRILCSPAMHDAAHAFANELYHAIWKHHESEVGDVLAPSREKLLQAARNELEQLAIPPRMSG